MTQTNSDVPFSFGWLAMKLLGKSLYSNTWSALSELVANGFDAGAKEVYIFIDIRDKEKSIIEIFDNGSGMTDKEIETYVKVGYNKRKDPKISVKKPMGRKGIGKLAALYLSQDYYILTKTKEGSSQWQMSYTELEGQADEKPFLRTVTEKIPLKCENIWDGFETGTFLKLTQVNLNGKGDVAFEGLAQKLSNYFSLNTRARKINLCIFTGGNVEFKEVEKTIAFDNMAFIEFSRLGKMSLKNEFDDILNKSIEIPYTKKITGKDDTYKHKIGMSNFDEDKLLMSNTLEFENATGKKINLEYTLKGWIGIHSSIGQNATSSFNKSRFYNPNQLRLYVRNKLAIENFLNVINNTQAFVNYIEGEISFDILDEDKLPDIATSNRQSMDEHDERIQLLKDLVTPIIQNLIKKRNDLAEKVKKEQEERQQKLETSAKLQFSKELEKEMDSFGDAITKDQKAEFTRTIGNKIKGDMIKHDYVVFLSHASANVEFTNFIYYLLLKRGAEEDEFFYTSKNGTPPKVEDTTTLSHLVKESILNVNTLLFYLTSKDYKDSEFCMFEGGAGWATRAVGEFILWSLEYDETPKFLTNGKPEMVLTESLSEKNYAFIVLTLNKVIEHINNGRRMKDEKLIEFFPITKFPDQVELNKSGKTIEDYMENDIKDYWKTYVQA